MTSFDGYCHDATIRPPRRPGRHCRSRDPCWRGTASPQPVAWGAAGGVARRANAACRPHDPRSRRVATRRSRGRTAAAVTALLIESAAPCCRGRTRCVELALRHEPAPGAQAEWAPIPREIGARGPPSISAPPPRRADGGEELDGRAPASSHQRSSGLLPPFLGGSLRSFSESSLRSHFGAGTP